MRICKDVCFKMILISGPEEGEEEEEEEIVLEEEIKEEPVKPVGSATVQIKNRKALQKPKRANKKVLIQCKVSLKNIKVTGLLISKSHFDAKKD